MKENIKTICTGVILFGLLFLLLSYPKDVIESVNFSISIWINNIFPTLFPFFVFSSFVSTYGLSYIFEELLKPIIVEVLHLPSKCTFIFISSLFSGFPSSSKFIKDALDEEIIDITNAEHLLSFCHFSSPLFVVGTIGSLLLGSKSLGIIIWICHIVASFFVGVIFRNDKFNENNSISLKSAFRKMRVKQKNAPLFANVLKSAIISALNTLFLLLGIVTIFLIFTNLLTKLISVSLFTKTIFSGILEMTQGIKNASLLNISLLEKSLLMISFISFGGFSVHTQVFSILADYPISYRKYFLARILHVLFACILIFIYFSFGFKCG